MNVRGKWYEPEVVFSGSQIEQMRRLILILATKQEGINEDWGTLE